MHKHGKNDWRNGPTGPTSAGTPLNGTGHFNRKMVKLCPDDDRRPPHVSVGIVSACPSLPDMYLYYIRLLLSLVMSISL